MLWVFAGYVDQCMLMFAHFVYSLWFQCYVIISKLLHPPILTEFIVLSRFRMSLCLSIFFAYIQYKQTNGGTSENDWYYNLRKIEDQIQFGRKSVNYFLICLDLHLLGFLYLFVYIFNLLMTSSIRDHRITP